VGQTEQPHARGFSQRPALKPECILTQKSVPPRSILLFFG
jgi:hypothetical protein